MGLGHKHVCVCVRFLAVCFVVFECRAFIAVGSHLHTVVDSMLIVQQTRYIRAQCQEKKKREKNRTTIALDSIHLTLLDHGL